MTSSEQPPAPGGPLRDDQADGPLQPSGSEHGALPDDSGGPDGSDDGRTDSTVPPVSHEPEQSEADAALQEENAETSLDQPSQ